MVLPSLVGTDAAGGTLGTNPSVTMPSSQLNDLILAYGICQSGAMTMVAAGWTAHPESIGANAPLFYRWATASEPASYTFDVPGAANSACRLAVYRGVDTADPFDVDGSQAGATGNITLPSLTPTNDGITRLGVHLIAKMNNTSFTPPGGGVTERWDAIASASSYVMAGGDESLAPGAASGTRVWAPAGGAALSIGYFITLNPIPPGEGTFTGGYDFTGSGFAGQIPSEGSFTGGYDFTGQSFVGVAGAPSAFGSFNGGYDFSVEGSGFAGSAPTGDGLWTPGGRDRFTVRRTPKNRRRYR